MLSSTGRLLTLAFERATQGIPRDVWRDDTLISSTRQPSDKLMMFLPTHLLPSRFGPVAPDLRGLRYPVGIATYELPIHLHKLANIDAPCKPLGASNDYPERPKLNPACLARVRVGCDSCDFSRARAAAAHAASRVPAYAGTLSHDR